MLNKTVAVPVLSLMAMIAFGDDGPEVKGLMSYRNSENPNAAGVQEQLQMFSDGEVREMYFNRDDVEVNARSREVLIISD